MDNLSVDNLTIDQQKVLYDFSIIPTALKILENTNSLDYFKWICGIPGFTKYRILVGEIRIGISMYIFAKLDLSFCEHYITILKNLSDKENTLNEAYAGAVISERFNFAETLRLDPDLIPHININLVATKLMPYAALDNMYNVCLYLVTVAEFDFTENGSFNILRDIIWNTCSEVFDTFAVYGQLSKETMEEQILLVLKKAVNLCKSPVIKFIGNISKKYKLRFITDNDWLDIDLETLFATQSDGKLTNIECAFTLCTTFPHLLQHNNQAFKLIPSTMHSVELFVSLYILLSEEEKTKLLDNIILYMLFDSNTDYKVFYYVKHEYSIRSLEFKCPLFTEPYYSRYHALVAKCQKLFII